MQNLKQKLNKVTKQKKKKKKKKPVKVPLVLDIFINYPGMYCDLRF